MLSKVPKKTEEEVVQEELTKLSDEEIMVLPRTTLERYCKALRFETKARKVDLQNALKKQAFKYRQHERRKQRLKQAKTKREPFVMFPGQRVPKSYPGARGSKVAWNSSIAGDLRGAAMRGDVVKMRRLLKGLDPEDRAKIANAGGLPHSAPGDNALHYACWKGQLIAAEWLVRHCGADVNAKGRGGFTPLHYAVKGLALSTITWLLNRGARVDIVDHGGKTPLAVCLELIGTAEAAVKAEAEDAELRGEEQGDLEEFERQRNDLNIAKLQLIEWMKNHHDQLIQDQPEDHGFTEPKNSVDTSSTGNTLPPIQ
mgnify:CR=1 FL=1